MIRPRARSTSAEVLARGRRSSRRTIPTSSRALTPSLERAITASVRRNPRPLADALFPVMGPAIRKAVAHGLAGMVESFNRTLELSLSGGRFSGASRRCGPASRSRKSSCSTRSSTASSRSSSSIAKRAAPAPARRTPHGRPSRTPTWSPACSRRFAISSHDSFGLGRRTPSTGSASAICRSGCAGTTRDSRGRPSRLGPSRVASAASQDALETIHLQFTRPTSTRSTVMRHTFDGRRPIARGVPERRYRARARSARRARARLVLAGRGGCWPGDLGHVRTYRATCGWACVRRHRLRRAGVGRRLFGAVGRAAIALVGLRDPLAADPQAMLASSGMHRSIRWMPGGSCIKPLIRRLFWNGRSTSCVPPTA